MRIAIAFPRNNISFLQNIISFPRNSISFPRNIISFPRNIITFPRNNNSFERNNNSFERNNNSFRSSARKYFQQAQYVIEVYVSMTFYVYCKCGYLGYYKCITVLRSQQTQFIYLHIHVSSKVILINIL